MKVWLARHRRTVLVSYSLLALTLILILQTLESSGVIR